MLNWISALILRKRSLNVWISDGARQTIRYLCCLQKALIFIFTCPICTISLTISQCSFSNRQNHSSEEILKNRRSENFRRSPGTHTYRGLPLIKFVMNEPKLTKRTPMSLWKKCSKKTSQENVCVTIFC